jgi:hypothetical protein
MKSRVAENQVDFHDKASFGLSDQVISREDHAIEGISYQIGREIV